MTTEMNIDIKIEETEKENLDKAYEVLSRIENSLSYLRDNGYYTTLDYVHLPQEVENIIEISKRIDELSWPGYEPEPKKKDYYSNEWLGL